jgi:hypothetical protein
MSSVFFVLSGPTCIKDARKMLMKLTPCQVFLSIVGWLLSATKIMTKICFEELMQYVTSIILTFCCPDISVDRYSFCFSNEL